MQKNQLLTELLTIADTEWVLGHWYIKNLLNSRNLQDATAYAAMAQDTLGHTRAMFEYLEDRFEMTESQLEFGRNSTEVANIDLLDNPPETYGEFVLTAYLVELAVWRMMASLQGNDNEVSSMMSAFGKESYFHRLNMDGWFAILTDNEKEQVKAAIPNCLGHALAWFGSEKASEEDALLKSGVRSQPVYEARTQFLTEAKQKLAEVTSLTADKIEAMIDHVSTGPRNNPRRRTKGTKMPATLWEYIVPTSDAAKIARRPLSVSTQDTIDLFDKPETVDFDYN